VALLVGANAQAEPLQVAKTRKPAAVAKPAPKDVAPEPQRIAEIAAMLSDSPRGVGRPIADRKAWNAVAKTASFVPMVAKAEHIAKEPVPETPDALYLDFYATGNRDRYQQRTYARYGNLDVLVLAECMENQGRFLPKIEEYLEAVLAQRSWVWPAHDSGHGTFDGRAMMIDLVSSDVAARLATIRYWLGDKLAPATREKIEAEVERRVLSPFEGAVRGTKPRPWWLTTTNNWNAVCLAGVTEAALANIEDRDRRAFFIASSEKCIQYFVDGFTPDGYCSEGLGYWNYGFGRFVLLAETICQATGGKLDLWDDSRWQKIAQFGRRIEIASGVYPAFADCGISEKPDKRIMAYVSRRFSWGWQDAERAGLLLSAGPEYDPSSFGIWGFPNSASQRPAAIAANAKSDLRDWFDTAGILICRPAEKNGRFLACALKGGHNAELHNHNDVGSYVVVLGKGTPLLDPGSEVYTARTFSARRYDSNVLNSFGHPVPRIGKTLQHTGRKAEGKVVRAEFTDECDTLTLEIGSAYATPGLESLRRTFVYSRKNAGQLSVTDEVKLARATPFETALVTLGPWRRLDANRLVVGKGDEAVLVKIDADGQAFHVKAEEIHEDLHGKIVPIRIGIALDEPVARGRITVTIAPAKQP
jgi:hypothetical protein